MLQCWSECGRFFTRVGLGRRDRSSRIFLTKQLNFLIYIIRTWEIGRPDGVSSSKADAKAANAEIMLCPQESFPFLCNPLRPMRQFDIASHLFRSYELRKELNKEKDFFSRWQIAAYFKIAVYICTFRSFLLKHYEKRQFVSSENIFIKSLCSHFSRLIWR